jgi:acetoacetate decarboxylase
MSGLSFFTPTEEIRKNPASLFSKGCEMRNEEGMFVCWETRMEVLQKIMPPCFTLLAPMVTAYIISMPDNNFGVGYKECALIVPVSYDGTPGVYFRSHFLNGSGAAGGTFVGRELAGFPKKLCENITIRRQADHFHGYCEKDGVRFLDIEATLGEYNAPEAASIFAANEAGEKSMGIMYLIKWDIEEDASGRVGFENARLVSNYADTTYTEWTRATATVTLRSTENAPWAELEVVRVLGAGYGKFENTGSSCKLLAQLDAKELEPYMMTSHYDCGYYNGFTERLY